MALREPEYHHCAALRHGSTRRDSRDRWSGRRLYRSYGPPMRTGPDDHRRSHHSACRGSAIDRLPFAGVASETTVYSLSDSATHEVVVLCHCANVECCRTEIYVSDVRI